MSTAKGIVEREIRRSRAGHDEGRHAKAPALFVERHQQVGIGPQRRPVEAGVEVHAAEPEVLHGAPHLGQRRIAAEIDRIDGGDADQAAARAVGETVPAARWRSGRSAYCGRP